ncbi:hypothetical protein ACIRVN_33775 [Streptomyces albogriseolus]|uniref:hypothetical protein n=1 Tax=Streptomyces albogriseolus TaxID=1887 RepID=UPI0038091195
MPGTVYDPDADDVVHAELAAEAAAAAAREAAAGLLTPSVLAHAALLAELASLVPGAAVDELAFAARLAATEPEAAGATHW